MLDQDDLRKIKQVVHEAVRPLDLRLESVERKTTSLELTLGDVKSKVDKMMEGISDLRLETKAIHKVIETQSENHEQRIERLEEQVGINN